MTSSRWFLAAVVVFVGAVGATAATDLEQFQKQVAKVAPADDGSKPKALCACAFGSGYPYDNRVGVIRQAPALGAFSGVSVACVSDFYDSAGNKNGGGVSCTNFYPLVK
jgi:hypothetical protein